MMRPLRFCVYLLLLSTTTGASLFGQADFGEGAFGPTPSIGSGPNAAFASPDFLQGFEAAPGVASATVAPQITGAYRLAPDKRSGILTITAEIPERHHIFSLTQKPGAPSLKSKLTLVSKDVVELDPRGFVATPSPHEVRHQDIAVPTEEHSGKVEWSVPFQIVAGVNLDDLPIRLAYDGQICSERDANGEGGVCYPPIKNQPIEATFQGMLTRAPLSPPAGVNQFTAAAAPASPDTITTAKPYRAEGSSAAIEISIAPRVAQPGDQVTLTVKAVADAKWHIYHLLPKDPKTGPKPTLIAIENPQPWMTGAPVASAEPMIKKATVDGQPDEHYHEDVTWTWTWTVPKTTEPGVVPIVGLVGYQTCSTTCLAPEGLKFSAQIAIGDAASASASTEIAVEASKYAAVAKLAQAREANPSASATSDFRLDHIEPAKGSTLAFALGFALLGGFVLNFMPCVLPVLGLKVYSFIEMAGESRAKVFWHNVAYILGLMVVFWGLGTVAVVFKSVSVYAGNTPLILGMIGLVFAMALSFLGLWEIPIPGFSGTSNIGRLAEKENLLGAFFKGVIATVLATPCGAPLLSQAYTQIFERHPAEVYLIFTFVGLGMAAPYFLIALNPQIVAKVLPKPGPWMIVFKQALAFLLLGTVAWLIFTLDFTYMLPAFVFVLGVWLACWIVGLAQHHYYDRRRMVAVWFASVCIIKVAAAFAFTNDFHGYHGVRGMLAYRYEQQLTAAVGERLNAPLVEAEESEYVLDWQPYTFETLQTLVAQNKTVVVDFTAEWCPNCKALEASVLNTKPIKDKVDAQGTVTLVADYTHADAEVDALLKRLTGSNVIPVLAIFPAGRPGKPIIFSNGYTTATLLAELDKAGASAGTVARVEAVPVASDDEEETVAVMTSIDQTR